MPDISSDTIERLWQETRSSSWESLRAGVDEIYRRQIIDRDMYNRIVYAVNKLEDLKVNFPSSASELVNRMDYYL